MTTSEAERSAMRRALALAVTPGVPLGPNPRVGCVLLAAGRHDDRRGLPPRRRHPPRRGRGAGRGRRRRPRRDRRRHPRAVQPHRPHRTVQRGARSPPAYAVSCSPSPTPTRSPSGGAARLREAGVDVVGGLLADEARAVNRAWTFAIEHRRPVRHLEVRHHPRRPQRRRRRHQPLGLQPRGPARHPPAARRCATRCSSAPHTVEVDDPELTVRDEVDEPVARPAAARRDGPARPRPRPPDPQRPRRDACTCAPATRRRRWRRLYARDRQHVFLEGGPDPGPRPSSRAGLVDEVVAYVAPMLLGAGTQRRRRPRASPPSPTPCTCTSPT